MRGTDLQKEFLQQSDMPHEVVTEDELLPLKAKLAQICMHNNGKRAETLDALKQYEFHRVPFEQVCGTCATMASSSTHGQVPRATWPLL